MADWPAAAAGWPRTEARDPHVGIEALGRGEGADIWTTALVVMAFGQVLARLGVLQVRRIRRPSALRRLAAPDTDTTWAAC